MVKVVDKALQEKQEKIIDIYDIEQILRSDKVKDYENLSETPLGKTLDLDAQKDRLNQSAKIYLIQNSDIIDQNFNSKIDETVGIYEKQLNEYERYKEEAQEYVNATEDIRSNIPILLQKLNAEYEKALEDVYIQGKVEDATLKKIEEHVNNLREYIEKHQKDNSRSLGNLERKINAFYTKNKEGTESEKSEETVIYESEPKLEGKLGEIFTEINKNIDELKILQEFREILEDFENIKSNIFEVLEPENFTDLETGELMKVLDVLLEYKSHKEEIEESKGWIKQGDIKLLIDDLEQAEGLLRNINNTALDSLKEGILAAKNDISAVHQKMQNFWQRADNFLKITSDFLQNFNHEISEKFQREENILSQLNQIRRNTTNYKTVIEKYNIESEIKQLQQNINKGDIEAVFHDLNNVEKALKHLDILDTDDLSKEIIKIKENISEIYQEYLNEHVEGLKELNLRSVTFSEENTIEDLADIICNKFPALQKINFAGNHNISFNEWVNLIDEFNQYGKDIKIDCSNTVLSNVLKHNMLYNKEPIEASNIFKKWQADIVDMAREIPELIEEKIEDIAVVGLGTTSLSKGDGKFVFNRFKNLKSVDISASGIDELNTLEEILDGIKNDVKVKVSPEYQKQFALEKNEFTKAEYEQFKISVEAAEKIQDAYKKFKGHQQKSAAALTIQKVYRGRKGRKEAAELGKLAKEKGIREEIVKMQKNKEREEANKKLQKEIDSAKIIQRAVRKFLDKSSSEIPKGMSLAEELGDLKEELEGFFMGNFQKVEKLAEEEEINKEDKKETPTMKVDKTPFVHQPNIPPIMSISEIVASQSKDSATLTPLPENLSKTAEMRIMRYKGNKEQSFNPIYKYDPGISKSLLDILKEQDMPIQEVNQIMQTQTLGILPSNEKSKQLMRGKQWQDMQLQFIASDTLADALRVFALDIPKGAKIIIPFGEMGKEEGALVVIKDKQRNININHIGSPDSALIKLIQSGIEGFCRNNVSAGITVNYNFMDIEVLKRLYGQNTQYAIAQGAANALAITEEQNISIDMKTSENIGTELKEPVMGPEKPHQEVKIQDIQSVSPEILLKTDEVKRQEEVQLKEQQEKLKETTKEFLGQIYKETTEKLLKEEQARATERPQSSIANVSTPKKEFASIQTQTDRSEEVSTQTSISTNPESFVSKIKKKQKNIYRDTQYTKSIYEHISNQMADEYVKKYSTNIKEIFKEKYLCEVKETYSDKVLKDYMQEREKILNKVSEEISKNKIEPQERKEKYKEYNIGDERSTLMLKEEVGQDGKIKFNIDEIMSKKGSCSISVLRTSPEGKKGCDVIEVVNGELKTFVLSGIGESKIAADQIQDLSHKVYKSMSLGKSSYMMNK